MSAFTPLIAVSIFSILSCLLLSYEAVQAFLARRRRKRSAAGGAYGVVVDRDGRLMGTYVDPYAHPWRTARMHGADSPWAPAVGWGQCAFVWEGFGETPDDALLAANRLRRRHIQFLALTGDIDPGDCDAGGDDILTPPGRPPWLGPAAGW